MTKRAVVIGAGLGGLATAARLARTGWRVTVCEAGDSFGGKMNRWAPDGFHFDTGPSLITMPWVFRETFEAAGGRLEDYAELVRLDPIAQYRFDDGTEFDYTSRLPEWHATLGRLNSLDVEGFHRFMALGGKLFELSSATFFRRSPFERPRLSELRAITGVPLRHAWGNYQRMVESFFRDRRLRQLFGRYPTYVGSSPYQAPSTLAVIPYIEFSLGGYAVRGGLYRIVEGLADLARAAGAELRACARVTRIVTSRGSVSHVELSGGERIDCDVAVMNGDAATLDELLGRNRNEAGENSAAPPDRSMSGVVFLFGLNRRLRGIQPHTVMFSADYRREFSQIFEHSHFPEDPTVYVNAPSVADRSLAPEGGETLFVMANAPASHTVWDAKKICEARSRILARLRRSGFPAFEGAITVSDVWTPNRLANRYLAPGGAIYGGNSHGWKNAFLRPANRSRKADGLYLVGGSSHPGGGTPTVLMSAAITTRLIERRFGN